MPGFGPLRYAQPARPAAPPATAFSPPIKLPLLVVVNATVLTGVNCAFDGVDAGQGSAGLGPSQVRPQAGQPSTQPARAATPPPAALSEGDKKFLNKQASACTMSNPTRSMLLSVT